MKCVFGIPYALASECNINCYNPIRIRSNGKEYNISLQIKEFEGKINPKVFTNNSNLKEGTETSITLHLYEEDWGL